MAAVGGETRPKLGFDNKENAMQPGSRKRPFQDEDEVIEEDFDLEPPEDDLEADLLAADLVRKTSLARLVERPFRGKAPSPRVARVQVDEGLLGEAGKNWPRPDPPPMDPSQQSLGKRSEFSS